MFSQWLPSHWVIVSSSFNRKLWYFPYHDGMLTCMVNTQVTMLTCKLIYAIILLRFHECNFSVVSRNTNLQLFFWSSSLKPFNLLFQDIPWALVWRLCIWVFSKSIWVQIFFFVAVILNTSSLFAQINLVQLSFNTIYLYWLFIMVLSITF